MTLKRIFLIQFILLSQVVIAQIDDLPFYQPFLKTGYSYTDSSKPMHALNAEISLYINSFGNTVECGENQSFGGCIITNIVFMMSAFELTGGFDAALHNRNTYLVPKAGFFLRPLYFGKAGINVSTFGVYFGAGISIPTKKDYLVEILYQDNLQNFKHSPILENVSRFQIGLQIPLK